MRKREPRVIVTFHTTAEAMATERMCAAHGLAGRLISAPRQLSADCGIAWSGAAETRDALSSALAAEGIEYAGLYELEV
jgi:hypothetical protein